MRTRTYTYRAGRIALGLLATIAATGCTPLISGYTLDAYTNATKMKAQTLAIVDAAADPYPAHAQEVRELQTNLNAAYEFSRGTSYNHEATEMWRIIRNPAERHTLIGTFFAIWRDNRVGGQPAGLGQAYRNGKKANLVVAFDRLICLEANKKEKTKCPAFATENFTPAADDAGSTMEPGNE